MALTQHEFKKGKEPWETDITCSLSIQQTKRPAKRFSDYDWRNGFQPVRKKTRHQKNVTGPSPPPCAMARDHFTIKDLQRCLFSQSDVRLINFKQPAVTQQSECFCEYAGTICLRIKELREIQCSFDSFLNILMFSASARQNRLILFGRPGSKSSSSR